MAALAALATSRNAFAFVVGWPLNMDGSQGPAAQRARQFAADLIRQTELFPHEVDVALWDERLSTQAVNRLMIDDMDLTRSRRARSVDRMAATYILQGALDHLAGNLS